MISIGSRGNNIMQLVVDFSSFIFIFVYWLGVIIGGDMFLVFNIFLYAFNSAL